MLRCSVGGRGRLRLDVSALDAALVDTRRIHGPKQLTDIYLLALAVRHGGNLVFNPSDEFMLEPGQHVIVMASPQGRQELEGALLPD